MYTNTWGVEMGSTTRARKSLIKLSGIILTVLLLRRAQAQRRHAAAVSEVKPPPGSRCSRGGLGN
jgi:hypothetical protein